MAKRFRESGKISCSCLRDSFRKKLVQLGLLVEEFGESRGASATANAKVSDRLFKRHGRWRLENAKDGYVKDDVDYRLEVSRRLGLYLQ